MKIFEMNLNDVEKIGNILQNEFDDFWNTNILRSEILSENHKYIVAKSDSGEILGFAGILINVDVVEIMNIVVKKKYRKQGIGESLLLELIEISKKTNLEYINLEVNELNLPAINLYKKLGFLQIRR